MRTALLSMCLMASLFGIAGCQATDNPNSPAIQALDNPPNSCGPGGSQNIEDCQSGGR